VENNQSQNHYAAYIRNMNNGGVGSGASSHQPTTTATNEPGGVVDDVLTFILLSIAVSGGDFKSDCFKWWSKAIRLTLALGLHREDDRCSASVSPCANPLCSCRRDQDVNTLAGAEACEERRRVFWLVYCLDRHLSLSFNSVLAIPDSYCEVYCASFLCRLAPFAPFLVPANWKLLLILTIYYRNSSLTRRRMGGSRHSLGR
jgi:hypothetical protein